MTPMLVRPTHLSRLAVIYVRQSSPEQVALHVEGRERQYRLADRAEALGWPDHRRLIIDDDQGLSGAYSFNRPGYQRLISLLALREVGVVLGLEVSRLARNCLDWYPLLELAAAFDVLIADEDGLYDPAEINDRLLLGLKGTFSEVERYQIRARMQRGRLHKAQRGALLLPLPIGFERRLGSEDIHITADQAVRHAVERIFTLYAQLGSIRAVLRYLRRAGLEAPRRVVVRGLGSTVRWLPPSYDAVYHILTNPLYAGVYCFGKRRSRVNPLTHERHTVTVARQDWDVFLPAHHAGYIDLPQYEDNMARLEAHRPDFVRGPGAPREGRALLQGVVYCQHCGLRMRVRYQGQGAYYTCDRDQRRFDAPVCCRASATRVDGLVEELVLGVLNAGTVELSLAQEQLLAAEEAQRERDWREKLQRLEYGAALARRRYEMVDPTNRLVAQTLETDWNTALAEVETARAAYRRTHEAHVLLSTLTQIQEVVAQFPTYWYSGMLEPQDKKEILRCLIERVFLRRDGDPRRGRLAGRSADDARRPPVSVHLRCDLPSGRGAGSHAHGCRDRPGPQRCGRTHGQGACLDGAARHGLPALERDPVRPDRQPDDAPCRRGLPHLAGSRRRPRRDAGDRAALGCRRHPRGAAWGTAEPAVDPVDARGRATTGGVRSVRPAHALDAPPVS